MKKRNYIGSWSNFLHVLLVTDYCTNGDIEILYSLFAFCLLTVMQFCYINIHSLFFTLLFHSALTMSRSNGRTGKASGKPKHRRASQISRWKRSQCYWDARKNEKVNNFNIEYIQLFFPIIQLFIKFCFIMLTNNWHEFSFFYSMVLFNFFILPCLIQ